MSCSDVPEAYVQKRFYNFKVGAYRKKSGVRFSKEFLEEIEGMEEEDDRLIGIHNEIECI